MVAYNYFISLLTALRKVRLAATMEFLNGVLFAVLGIGLLLIWQCDSASVVIAYSGSCLLSIVGGSRGGLKRRGRLRRTISSPCRNGRCGPS